MKNTYNFDFEKNEFVMKDGSPARIGGKAALKMWIDKCIRSYSGLEMYRGTGYGTAIEELAVGHTYGFGFTAAEAQRELREALSKNDDIHSINKIDVSQEGKTLKILVELDTVYGQQTTEVEL